MAGTDRSIAQLNLLVQDDKILMRDERGVLNPRTGQRLLDFDLPDEFGVFDPLAETESSNDPADHDSSEDQTISIPFASVRPEIQDRRMADWNAEEWFHEGCRLTEEAELESAINALRNAMSLLSSEFAAARLSNHEIEDNQLSLFPDPAEVNFHLADALYRTGRLEAAAERYYCAIESAPDFIEAWTQLGCLQSELDQPEIAEQSFVTAISIHPENPDALLHYAQLLDQIDRNDEAIDIWKQYLQYDSRGPWADHARDRIAKLSVLRHSEGDVFG